MTKPSLSSLSRSQWFYVVTPTIAASIAAWHGRHELEFPVPLYFVAAGIGVSLLLGFLILYGDKL